MRKIRYQNIFLVLLILVFSGQVIASASTACQNKISPVHGSEQTLISDKVDHSQHMGMQSSQADVVSSKYCPDCADCNLHHCLSSVTLLTAQNLFSLNIVSLAKGYHEQVQQQLSTSLFRPPIFR